MTTEVSHVQIETARVVARAAQQRWQRTRSGIDRLFAETLGSELAALEIAALEASRQQPAEQSAPHSTCILPPRTTSFTLFVVPSPRVPDACRIEQDASVCECELCESPWLQAGGL